MNADVGEGVGVEGGRVDERGRGRRCEGRRRKEPRKCDRKRNEGVIEADGGVQQMVTAWYPANPPAPASPV